MLIPQFGALGYMGAMILAYLLSIIVVFGIFASKLPDIMRCYPLCRTLALFGVLMGFAIYVNQNFNLPLAIMSAIVLSAGMTLVLAIPLSRDWQRIALSALQKRCKHRLAARFEIKVDRGLVNGKVLQLKETR